MADRASVRFAAECLAVSLSVVLAVAHTRGEDAPPIVWGALGYHLSTLALELFMSAFRGPVQDPSLFETFAHFVAFILNQVAFFRFANQGLSPLLYRMLMADIIMQHLYYGMWMFLTGLFILAYVFHWPIFTSSEYVPRLPELDFKKLKTVVYQPIEPPAQPDDADAPAGAAGASRRRTLNSMASAASISTVANIAMSVLNSNNNGSSSNTTTNNSSNSDSNNNNRGSTAATDGAATGDQGSSSAGDAQAGPSAPSDVEAQAPAEPKTSLLGRMRLRMMRRSPSVRAEVVEKEQELRLPAEDAVCAICLDEYAAGDRLHQLPCGHHLHVVCSTEWLKVNGTCPLCKDDVHKSLKNGHQRSTRSAARTARANRVLVASNSQAPAAEPASRGQSESARSSSTQR
ncbi:hypothetical protein HK105_202487 [Polyrhizophydium stewartii]|uniref:RING-type E3 ubiquitin transferase n=1 Tax=Polyrhizophydium stewartii TaxID=2732419 RepID=A0ABR4NEW6_9FUNG